MGEAEVQGQVRRAYEAALAAGTTGPDAQPALPRRPADRQARAHRDRARRQPDVGPHRRRRPRPRGRRRPARPRRRRRRRGRDGRADRPRAGRAGRAHDVRRQPPGPPRARAGRALRRLGRRARRAARRCSSAPTSSSPRRPRRTRSSAPRSSTSSCAGAASAARPARPHRHRRAPRRRARLRRPAPACTASTWTTCRAPSPRTSRCARASARAPRPIVEEELRRFATWLGQRDVAPTVAALREHGTTIVEQVLAENAARWETASPRDVARVEAVARAVMQRLLHEPTIRLKALQESGDHARQQVVRELFGLQEGTDAAGRAGRGAGGRPPAAGRRHP